MKVNIISEKDNPLLKRKELGIEIVHESSATPSRAALQQLLSKQIKKEAVFIDIRNIFSEKGIEKSRAKVFIWEEKGVEDLSKAAETKKAEKKEEAKPAEGEAKPEEKKEEKPVKAKKEEKTEAPKEEKK